MYHGNQVKYHDEWGNDIMCPVYKSECGNYRGISVLLHINKIYERILERRLRSCVEEKLGEWQHGFRPNTSTADIMFSMKMVLEKSWEFNTQSYIAFLF